MSSSENNREFDSGKLENNVSIALIAAVATNGVIGKDNALPWRIPEDLRYFKQVTMGKKIVMGRKTFESFGRPLPGRKHIVITRNKNWRPGKAIDSQNIDIVHTVEEALALAVKLSLRDGNREVMVIGGEQIYRETLSSAQRLYITQVFADVEGDASFPALNYDQWQEIERRENKSSASNALDYAFTVLDRVTG